MKKMVVHGRAWLLLLAAVSVWPATAQGEEGGAETARAARTAIMVLDVRPSGPVNAEQVAGLSAIVTSEVASLPGLRVIASSDVREIMGFEAQRQLLGCDDNSCFAEIGGALGASYLLSSEVSHFGSSWLFTLVLLDLAQTEPISRLTVRKNREEELLDEIGPAIRRVLSVLIDESGARDVNTSRQPRSVTGGAIIAWSSVAAGAGALAGGSLLYVQGRSRAGEMREAEEPLYTREEVDGFRREANLGLGLMMGGVALAGGALAWRLIASRPPRAAVIAAGPRDAEAGTGALLLSPLILGDGGGLMVEVQRW